MGGEGAGPVDGGRGGGWSRREVEQKGWSSSPGAGWPRWTINYPGGRNLIYILYTLQSYCLSSSDISAALPTYIQTAIVSYQEPALQNN